MPSRNIILLNGGSITGQQQDDYTGKRIIIIMLFLFVGISRLAQKMSYYRQRNTMSLPFVKKGPTYYGPRFIPLYGSKYPLSINIPVHEERRYAPPRPPPYGATKYQPRRVSVCPEPPTTKHPEVNLTRKLARASLRNPRPGIMYSGVTKYRHDNIAKGPQIHVQRVPMPRMSKGPVIYTPSNAQVFATNDPVICVTKSPILYSTSSPKPCEDKVPLPRMTKGPVLYATKGTQPYVTNSSQVHGSKGILSRAAKHALSRVKKSTKGPRLISTKVPRLGVMKPSRLWLNKLSQSQPSLTKNSQPNLAKGSVGNLAKGSQPILIHTGASPSPKKQNKNVKISTTGKKYSSATKWF